MTTSPPSPFVPLWRRAIAELLGTLLLVVVVVGSGIMAERRSPTDPGLQLLENSTATALGLTVLILVFGPVSGAQFNPLVTVADRLLHRRPSLPALGVVIAAQLAGAAAGAVLANAMFGVPTTISTTERASAGTMAGEVIATAGLVIVVFALVRTGRAALAAPAVGAYIGAAYWFTSSTAFANPAVTAGRILSETFAGIAPASAGWFALAQVAGAGIGVVIVAALFPRRSLG